MRRASLTNHVRNLRYKNMIKMDKLKPGSVLNYHNVVFGKSPEIDFVTKTKVKVLVIPFPLINSLCKS